MKKTKLLLTAGLALVLACSAGFAGCGAREYELSSYRGETKDADGNTVYNTELFYSNQVQQGYPDPQVLDDTERSGYYYLFGTWNSFTTMRSNDLVNWEDVGPTFLQRQSEDVRRATASNLWAPEVIYDEDTELYYMFFSATPEADSTYTDGNAGQGVVTNSHMYNMYVATSSDPAGPYTMVDFSKEENCHLFEQEDGSYKGRVHNGYNTERGKVLSDMTAEDELTGKYAYVEENIDPQMLMPQVDIDSELLFSDITPAFRRDLNRFQPFGPGNVSPVFVTYGVSNHGDAKLVGVEHEHLRMDLIQRQKPNTRLQAIAFQQPTHFEWVRSGRPIDVCYQIVENHYRGTVTTQLRIKDIKPVVNR